MKKAVLLGLSRHVSAAARGVLSSSHSICEVPGFAPRYRDKIADASIVVVCVDAMSNKTLEEIYGRRAYRSVIIAVRGNNSARRVPSKHFLHLIPARSIAGHLAKLI